MIKCVNFLFKSSLNFNAVYVNDLAFKSAHIYNRKLEDQWGHYGALLADLLKAFDSVS